jgi:hypothetical protein
MAWQNKDGLQVKFGSDWRRPPVNVVRSVNSTGPIKELVLDVDLTRIADGTVTYTSDLNNDGTLDGFNTGDVYLPANANVLSCDMIVKVAAAGGTSIKIGTFGLTGTAIDDDFFVTTTEGAKAKIDTVGARTAGAGVGVTQPGDETAGVGTADAYIGITGAGTWTAGKLLVIIRYVDPLGDA